MRKQTHERARALALADDFEGLPPNHSRWTLCDDIERARVPLGLDSDSLWLLRFLIRRTSEQDWARGREPVIAWSRFEIMAESGWSEDKLARVENRLCNSGLIAFRDAPNCKRAAYRQADGVMPVRATGISLAPAGTRALEIAAMAFDHQEAFTRLSKRFGEAFNLRAEIAGLLRLDEAPPELASCIGDIYRSLPSRRDHTMTIDVLERLVSRAQEVIMAVKAFFGFACTDQPATNQSAAAAPKGQFEQSEAQHRDVPAASLDQSTVVNPQTALNASSSPAPQRSPHRIHAVHKYPESKSIESDQDISGVLAASPEIFRCYIEQVRKPGLSPQRIIEIAADRYASNVAVAPSVVGRMHRNYGLSAALKALFHLGTMLERGSDIRNPSGYVLSIAQRATKDGEGSSASKGWKKPVFCV